MIGGYVDSRIFRSISALSCAIRTELQFSETPLGFSYDILARHKLNASWTITFEHQLFQISLFLAVKDRDELVEASTWSPICFRQTAIFAFSLLHNFYNKFPNNNV